MYHLASLMGWTRDITIGKLHLFWYWCSLYIEDGDLRKYPPTAFALAVDLPPTEGDNLLKNLIASHFVDEKPFLRIHNWWKYFGRFLSIRYHNNPIKLNKIKRLYNIQKTSLKTSPCTDVNIPYSAQPNLTIPNHTKPEEKKNPPTPLSKSFGSFWEGYPNRQGRKNALRHFEASVKTEGDVGNLERALGNYLRSENVRSGFIKNGSTWFNEWQDWVNPTETMIGKAGGRPSTTSPKMKLWKCEDCGMEMPENKRESHTGPACPKWKPPSEETRKEFDRVLHALKEKMKVV
jgi:hypothetical protein